MPRAETINSRLSMLRFDRDLLGDPVDPGHGCGGRPRHIATDARRAMVRQLREAGQPQEAIAAALGITGPTLRRHYHRELGSASQTWRRYAAENF